MVERNEIDICIWNPDSREIITAARSIFFYRVCPRLFHCLCLSLCPYLDTLMSLSLCCRYDGIAENIVGLELYFVRGSSTRPFHLYAINALFLPTNPLQILFRIAALD